MCNWSLLQRPEEVVGAVAALEVVCVADGALFRGSRRSARMLADGGRPAPGVSRRRLLQDEHVERADRRWPLRAGVPEEVVCVEPAEIAPALAGVLLRRPLRRRCDCRTLRGGAVAPCGAASASTSERWRARLSRACAAPCPGGVVVRRGIVPVTKSLGLCVLARGATGRALERRVIRADGGGAGTPSTAGPPPWRSRCCFDGRLGS